MNLTFIFIFIFDLPKKGIEPFYQLLQSHTLPLSYSSYIGDKGTRTLILDLQSPCTNQLYYIPLKPYIYFINL